MQEQAIRWERADASRVPFALYTGADGHKKELERFFYRSHWNYIGLEAEVPIVGDVRRSKIGARSVLITRSSDSQVHVLETVCPHPAMALCPHRTRN